MAILSAAIWRQFSMQFISSIKINPTQSVNWFRGAPKSEHKFHSVSLNTSNSIYQLHCVGGDLLIRSGDKQFRTFMLIPVYLSNKKTYLFIVKFIGFMMLQRAAGQNSSEEWCQKSIKTVRATFINFLLILVLLLFCSLTYKGERFVSQSWHFIVSFPSNWK